MIFFIKVAVYAFFPKSQLDFISLTLATFLTACIYITRQKRVFVSFLRQQLPFQVSADDGTNKAA
jgi:hypothetical protein